MEKKIKIYNSKKKKKKKKIFPCANEFKVPSHFLSYYRIQCIWFYVEVLDPLGLEICAR